MILKIKKLNEEAKIPFKATDGALGMDLYCINDIELYPFTPTIINTGIAIEPPEGFGLEIRDRSSLGAKGIKYLGGEIDYDYRGEIKVVLINLTQDVLFLKKHDRIAQMIPKKIHNMNIELVTELNNTVRGSGGFGSTNKKTV